MIGTVGNADAVDLRFVAFACCGLRFAIPLAISPLPGAPSVLLGVMNFHGSVIPVADVGRRLGRSSPSYGPDSHLLLARTSRRTLALAVEEVLGVLEAPALAITAGTLLWSASASPVVGAMGLLDGVVLLHDLEAFLSAAEERQLDRALEEQR